MQYTARFLLILSLFLLTACGGDDDDDEVAEAIPNEFWGAVATHSALVNLRIDDTATGQTISAYLIDGFPNGLAEFFSGPASGDSFTLVSASGNAVLTGNLPSATGGIKGTVTFPDGSLHNVAMTRIRLGAGRYTVNIDANGHWTGSGPDGNVLTAQQQGNLLTGNIITATGERFDYQLHDMSHVLAYGAQSGQPDQYTVFVSTRANSIYGRGGNVSGGQPNANFVNFDLPITAELLPGIYFGRLRFQTDVLLIDINAPTQPGDPNTVRVYVSDGEPEPEGDIEWFVGTFSGNQFSLVSASGNALLDATVSATGVSGTVTYSNADPLLFFAGPAGEGAGIYDVTVDQANRLTGTSEEGGALDFVRTDFVIDGTITTPAGTVFPVRIHDLVRGLQYPDADQIATVPDTYVAFVSPRARFIVGRSGDVRTGSAGLNIIGLDKVCAFPN